MAEALGDRTGRGYKNKYRHQKMKSYKQYAGLEYQPKVKPRNVHNY
jgi:hypothetical protein